MTRTELDDAEYSCAAAFAAIPTHHYLGRATYAASKTKFVAAAEQVVPLLTFPIGQQRYPWTLDGYNSNTLFLRVPGVEQYTAGAIVDDTFDLAFEDGVTHLSVNTRSAQRYERFRLLAVLLDSVLERRD